MGAEPMTWLGGIIAAHGGNPGLAVIDDTRSVTGRDLMGKAYCAAQYLADLDLPEHAAVLALVTTNADALALLLAGAATSRPLAPVGPLLTVNELARLVRRTNAKIVLSERAFAERAQAVAARCDATRSIIPDFAISSTPLSEGPATLAAFYLHTAGTTGDPKTVGFTDAVLAARDVALRQLVGIDASHRFATGSPLHHIGVLGTVLVALAAGAGVIATQRFSIQWWRDLQEFGVIHCLLVPAMIEMLLSGGVLDVAPLRTLIYGASPITPTTLQRVLTLMPGVELVNLFGQTEGSPITCLTGVDHRRAAAGESQLLNSVGRAVPGLRLRIADPDSSGVGEVLASAAHLSRPEAGG